MKKYKTPQIHVVTLDVGQTILETCKSSGAYMGTSNEGENFFCISADIGNTAGFCASSVRGIKRTCAEGSPRTNENAPS